MSKMVSALLVNVFFMLSLCHGEPIVTTHSGKIQGFKSYSRTGKPYDSYLAIPYAKPPINELRLKPPVAFDKWDGIRNGSQDGPMCPQVDLITKLYVGDEDCLFLNVYVPRTPQVCNEDKKLLPVMVYIHGGGWSFESGNLAWYGPQNYMEFPIVLVTLNYRLGVLGFLSTNDSNAYGNYGMLDQVLALKWVQSNIKSFGGNPEQVTIVGNSAGSAAVYLHLLSPLSKGLFVKAICESGVGTNFWSFESNPLKNALKLAKLLNCSTSTTKEIVDCILKRTAKEIAEASFQMITAGFLPVNWVPVIDAPGGPGFLTESPFSLLASKKITNKVPVMIGATAFEGYTFFADMNSTFRYFGKEFFQKQFSETLPVFTPIQPYMTKIIDAIADRYYLINNDLNNNLTFLNVFSQIFGDAMFDGAIDQSCAMLSEAGLPVYKFVYAYIGQNCLASLFGFPCGLYSSHGDELFLQFRYLSPTQQMTSNDTAMSQVINSIWANFISKDEISIDDEIAWPVYDRTNPKYVELDLNPVIKDDTLSNTSLFWAVDVPSLLEEYNNIE